jgi:hypothetical protein
MYTKATTDNGPTLRPPDFDPEADADGDPTRPAFYNF